MYIYIGCYVVHEGTLNKIFQLDNHIRLLALFLWLMVAVFIPGFDIGSGSLGFSITGFVVSLIGSFFVLGISKRFNLRFKWIGKHTLYILCAHILLWRILDVFDLSSKALTFNPQVNFIVEASYEILGALVLAWLLSKTKILEFNKIKL